MKPITRQLFQRNSRTNNQKLPPIQSSKQAAFPSNFIKDFNNSVNSLIELGSIHLTDPRDQLIRCQSLQLPESLSRQQRNRAIQIWISKIVKQILSEAFKKFVGGELSAKQTKVYCSEHLLENIILLTKKNENGANIALDQQDFEVINKGLKKSLEYASLKYPLAQNNTEVNKKLERTISPINILDANNNNQILKSGLSFNFKHSGNYQEEIMRFFNFLLSTIEARDQKGQSRFQRFQEFFESIFLKAENKCWVNQFEKFNMNTESLSDSLDEVERKVKAYQAAWDIDEKIKQQAEEYQQKVREYTSFRINRKISENIKEFTPEDIQSGNLKLNDPALTRTLTKWCEQLQKKFKDQQYYLSKEEDIAQRNGYHTLFTKTGKVNVTNMVRKQYEAISQYLDNLRSSIYEFQSKNKYEKLKQDQNYHIPEVEKVIGKFAGINVRCIEVFIIDYLNRLIHGLVKVSQQYYDTSLKNLTNWQAPPQLLTFLIGDLLRCKFSSGQKQVLSIYKQIEVLSKLQPQKLKIIRVKNRLKEGTKDILINIRFQNSILCEIQLAVKNSINNFLYHSDKFSHYVYELNRTMFGPITEMANIWFSSDPRSLQYKRILSQEQTVHKNFFLKQHQCSNPELKAQQLPFICSTCNCNRYGNDYLNGIMDNMKCMTCKSYFICGGCRLNKMDESQVHHLIFELRPQLKISNIKLWKKCVMPNYGIFVPIHSKKVRIQYFKSFNIGNRTYLIGLKNKDIHLIKEIPANKLQSHPFFNQNIIFSTDQIKELAMITQQELLKSFVTQSYLKNAYLNGKQALALEGMSLENKDILKVRDRKAQNQITSVLFKDNRFEEIQSLSEHFPNLEFVTLNNNKIKDLKGIGNLQKIKRLRTILNSVKEIPDEIKSCQSLQTISLQHNQLTSITSKIGELRKLRQFWVSNNKLEKVPKELFMIKNMVILSLNNNKIEELPEDISYLENIKMMKLENNKIKKLPDSFTKLTTLQILWINNNQLDSFPRECQNMNIKKMSISFNKFQDFPVGVCQIKSLKFLYLSSNKIKAIPGEIGNLQNLIEFKFRANKIKELPCQLGNLKDLISINFGDNQISHVKDQFGSLVKLKRLVADHNQIAGLLPSFTNIKYLIQLDMQHNKLQQFPPQFLHLRELQSLKLQDNRITCLPDDIWELNNIQQLHVESNLITNVPDSIKSLTKLKDLGVGNPNVQYLTPIIYQLSTIKLLEVSCVNLKLIPSQIFGMVNLVELDVHGNQLTGIPDQIGKLKNLKLINGEENKLTKISGQIGKLREIRELKLKKNQLKELPKQLFKLRKIKILNVAFNSFEVIPSDFQNLNSLFQKSLFIFGNPIKKWECAQSFKNKLSTKSRKLIRELDAEKCTESEDNLASQQEQTLQ